MRIFQNVRRQFGRQFVLFLAVAGALLLVGCATPTRLVSSWQDTDFRGVPFRRVLVMGLGEDGASRRLFEDAFVRSLKAIGVDAVPSYTLGSGVQETDLQRVREMVQRSAADCVLTTRLVSVDKHTTVVPGQMMVVPTVAYRRGFYGYYSSAVLVQSPPTTHQFEVATLETNLWQTIGEKLVWSGVTESNDAAEARRGSAELAGTIARALRERGLI